MSVFDFLKKKDDKADVLAPPPPPSSPRAPPLPPKIMATPAPPKAGSGLQGAFNEPLPPPKAIGIPSGEMPSLPPLFKGQSPQHSLPPMPQPRSPMPPAASPMQRPMPMMPAAMQQKPVLPSLPPLPKLSPAPSMSQPAMQQRPLLPSLPPLPKLAATPSLPPLPQLDAMPPMRAAPLQPAPRLPSLPAMPSIAAHEQRPLQAPAPLKEAPKITLPSMPQPAKAAAQSMVAKPVASAAPAGSSKLAQMLEEFSLNDLGLDETPEPVHEVEHHVEPMHRPAEKLASGALYVGVADFEQSLIQMHSADDRLHGMQTNNERLGAAEVHTQEALEKLNDAFEYIQKHLLLMDEKLFKVS